MLRGDLANLQRRLASNPALIRDTSRYAHEASLLHYLAANGVETRRQVVPSNAAELARALLEAGCDPKATMSVYGGDHTLLVLLLSSAHPKAAGVADALTELLS